MSETIDWKIFEILLSSPSKKYIKKILGDCFKIRNNVWSFDEYQKTPVLQNICQDFNIDDAKAHKVLDFFRHIFKR